MTNNSYRSADCLRFEPTLLFVKLVEQLKHDCIAETFFFVFLLKGRFAQYRSFE